MPYLYDSTKRCSTYYWPGTMRVRYATSCQNQNVDQRWIEDRKVEKEGVPPDQTGWRPPQPYSRTVMTADLWKGTVRYWQKFSGNDQLTVETPYPYGTIARFDFSYPLANVPYDLISKAEIRCLTKIKDKRCDLAVTVAEALESSRMVAGLATALFSAYLAARRGRFADAARILHVRKPRAKEPEKAWAQMQLGWLPLIYEIHDIYEIWRYGFRPEGLRLSATSDMGREWPKYFTIEPAGQPVQRYKDIGRYGCKVRLDYSLTSAALSAAAGAGLTNPASVIWALVPMSFVLDWFVPVGDWLNALDADFGLQFKGGSRTVYRTLKRSGSIFHARDTRNGFSYVNLQGKCQGTDMVRTVYKATPIPVPFYYKLPTNFGQAVTAYSLARLHS